MADQVPPGWRDKIMHATLQVGDAVLMGSDAPPQHYQKPQGLFVSVSVAKLEDARSGPPASACSSIGSASRGWSTATRRPEPSSPGRRTRCSASGSRNTSG